MSTLTEFVVEDAALEWLTELGYAVLHGMDIAPEGSAPERGSYDEVLLTGRLRNALARLNPNLRAETLADVLRKVRQTETPSLIEENGRLHRYLVEGVPIEVAREDGQHQRRYRPADRFRRYRGQRLARGEPVHGDRARTQSSP